jgi:hypothetical protein
VPLLLILAWLNYAHCAVQVFYFDIGENKRGRFLKVT